ncbi:MAG: LamB/YcsF family protein [Solirubrobacteraceae bacterium]|nr:LamB/YcsF family protein [Solirubrobacteraceae bacterium]
MSGAPVIDLNADLGEDAGHDAELLAIVTSANVSCGAHAGGIQVASRTIADAVARGVAIGAHPGHADREHFGRRALPISEGELERLLSDQLTVLGTASVAVGKGAAARPRYLKLHGALYHQAADAPELAAATVRMAKRARLALLGPPGSLLLARAREEGLVAVAEGFVDRGYELDAAGRPQLIARGAPGALLEPAAAIEQAVRIATTGTVGGSGGEEIPIDVRSLCVHGDSPGAVRMATEVRAALERAGVELRAFAP